MPLTPQGYRPRLIDGDIAEMLELFGAVSVEGPRYCGKTWASENHAESEMKLAESSGPIPNRVLVSANPDLALQGDRPHLIDEWQEVPLLWDHVRGAVDRSGLKGQFILTGSSLPRRTEYVHNGTGRIGKIRMRTMSLFESGDSDAKISLKGLFDDRWFSEQCDQISLESLADLIIRGGWPGLIGNEKNAHRFTKDYVDSVIEDAAMMDGKERSVRKMRMLFRSLARNESTLASNVRIMSDMEEYDGESVSVNTLDAYTDCLQRLHLLDDIPGFSVNVRSSVRVGKSSKRHLVDVSLAVAALGLKRDSLVKDLRTFGLLFESMCLRDLRIYAEHRGWNLFHYRDSRGREIDAVVETDDGRWGAFEIKLGTNQIDAAAENLLKLSAFFQSEGKPPSVLCVICGMAQFAYRRPDGVYVVPITSLGP